MKASLHYKKGDATNPAPEGNKIIVHVCNDIGGWGRGFVLALSKRWPAPEQAFRKWYQSKDNYALGEAIFVMVEPDIWVGNMIGQHDIVTGKDGTPPVRYDAIAKALSKVAVFAEEKDASVHMPRIGCGMAGGTWDKMEPIILKELVNKGIETTVYDLS